jgi:pimeloyl-ACP methyl ester carboxylesterase
VERGRAVKGKIEVEDIAVDPASPRSTELSVSLEIPGMKDSVLSRYIPSGVITTLDDERFDEQNGYFGLYQPVAYFERVNGFVYMLEEYDPGKIPIIFVHGIGSTPKDWQNIVEGLDRKHFQPWFFYYPSGLRLETIAEVFHDTFLSTKAVRIDRMVIAAHSQGGLVVREAMNICDVRERGNVPRLFISICTPYGGVDMAAAAVAHSPVIIPSWIDLASDSAFINALHRRDLPRGMTFNLFFAYGGSHFLKLGPDDDGTISLKSQLNPSAQKEAAQIRGFDEKHSDILRNMEMLDEFKSGLAGVK